MMENVVMHNILEDTNMSISRQKSKEVTNIRSSGKRRGHMQAAWGQKKKCNVNKVMWKKQVV